MINSFLKYQSALVCATSFVLVACGGGASSSVAPTATAMPLPLPATASTASTSTAGAAIAVNVDTTAPTAPSAFTFAGSTADSISFSWQASTDNVGVVSYEIWRNGIRLQVIPASKTAFTDIALGAGTNYTYSVLAVDAAGNGSALSAPLAARTQVVGVAADTQAPSAPSALKLTLGGTSSLSFNWAPSSDNVGVVRYDVYMGANLVGSTAQPSYIATGLTANTVYSFSVKAVDAASNVSAASTALQTSTDALAAVSAPDTSAPSVPAALVASQVTTSTLTLGWAPSTDNVGVVSYDVLRNGTLVGSSAAPGYTYSGLAAGTSYSLSVKAVDAAGNKSAASAALAVSTLNAAPAPDTAPPSTPTGLTVSNPTASTLSLSWTASTDNVGVTGYALFVNGVQVGSSTSTAFTFTGLNAATSYNLSVKATDAAGNLSSMSSSQAGSTTSASGFAITAATLGSSTVTVTGVGFGTKPQAAPLKFEDFDGRTTGAAPATIGYTNYGGFGGTMSVDNSEAYSGGKSLRHQGNFGPVSNATDVAESFPHIAVTGFSATELFLSYRLRYDTNGGRLVQLKFNRSGMEVPGASGSPCYGGQPKFFSSYYPDGPSADRYSSDKRLTSVQGGVVRDDGSRSEGWVGEPAMGSGTVRPLSEGEWVQVEEYYRLNDIGQANGEHVTWVNGNLQFNRHDIQMRTSTAQVLNCSYLVIGMDYWINPTSTAGPSVWYDDHYLDTSRARLVLANAATWAASTIRSPQPATTWSATSVVAQLKTAGFTAGSDAWLYVVRADGTTSAGWKITLN